MFLAVSPPSGGGGLCSWAGEVAWEPAGVLYSDELSEFSLSVLNVLIVVCMTRRASKVEEKGSSRSSSCDLLSCISKATRESSFCSCNSGSFMDLSWLVSVECMMDASRPRSIWRPVQDTTGSASDTGVWGRGGGLYIEEERKYQCL